MEEQGIIPLLMPRGTWASSSRRIRKVCRRQHLERSLVASLFRKKRLIGSWSSLHRFGILHNHGWLDIYPLASSPLWWGRLDRVMRQPGMGYMMGDVKWWSRKKGSHVGVTMTYLWMLQRKCTSHNKQDQWRWSHVNVSRYRWETFSLSFVSLEIMISISTDAVLWEKAWGY